MPPMPARSRRRTGHDTLADLQDAPASLRNSATWPFGRMAFPDDGDPQLIGRDDLLRWANAIEEITTAPRWKAYAYLAAAFLAGLVVGVGL